MNSLKKLLLTATTLVIAMLGLTAPAHADSTKLTGRDCVAEIWFDGNGFQHDGSRCAQARIHYTSQNAVTWKISYYEIRYDVSAGLSYGPHNNENPYKVGKGFQSGTQTWLSPDSGDANVGWFSRSDFPTSYTYKGQTVVNIDAMADIPGASDPRLDLDTATW
jgi:hypothetical protein